MIFKIKIDHKIPLNRNMEFDQGWKLIQEGLVLSGEYEIKPRPLLVGDEERIEFDEVIKRRVADGLFCQKHAEAIFANVAILPSEWQRHHIIFPNTIWKGLFMNLFDCIPVIHMLYPGKWELYFRWIGHGFTKHDHILEIT